MDCGIKKPCFPDYSKLVLLLKLGSKYEHYTGKQYKIIASARHTETLEEVVVYQALYGDMNVWVRSAEMFCGDVEIKGHIVPRFKRLENR